MVWELGEILVRVQAGSQSFEPKTSPVHDAMTPSDVAAAMASIKIKAAGMLVQAKYIDHNPKSFDLSLLVHEYQHVYSCRMRRIDTIGKLAIAAVGFFVNEPRCLKCRGHAKEWDEEDLRFMDCTSCGGTGGRAPSLREISRLSGMSRSKIKKQHVNCFWHMYEILSIWESGAADQIRRALRKN